jgi:DmsE family decaheme c-type cytochrome
METVQHVMSK